MTDTTDYNFESEDEIRQRPYHWGRAIEALAGKGISEELVHKAREKLRSYIYARTHNPRFKDLEFPVFPVRYEIREAIPISKEGQEYQAVAWLVDQEWQDRETWDSVKFPGHYDVVTGTYIRERGTLDDQKAEN